MTLYDIQKLLNHASPVMTQRYSHLADEALQRAAGVVGDVFNSVNRQSNVVKLRKSGGDSQ